ncbi:MAG: DUF1800 domain-containing protein [Chitinophagales bacterium]|nr:DUF1800 domain-containing protein [Chitinophagales bacterium]MCO5281183.1 DUF1800 domain-containing protein [Chitinophagales bacterium]HRP39116.1 DUF1800 domain-containing protein [Chitinophagales bacterium]
MNRRQFLTGFLTEEQSQNSTAAPRGSSTDTSPYNGQWTKKEIAHLLRRTMYGAAYSDITYFANKTLAQTVDELLTTGTAPSPPLNYYGTDSGAALGQTWVNASLDVNANINRGLSLLAWEAGNMVNQSKSLEEKMVIFWLNHFGTNIQEYADARYGYKHISTIRQHCLGNFKDLVRAITIDPAMLHFLNGYKNTKAKPDENYGRELMELFTVGKDGGQKYSEDDVKEAARVLTGYRIVTSNATYVFDSSKHDTGTKTFSAFYSNTTISGKSGAAGEQELDELLNMIFATQEVALFICRRLYRYFVYYEIDSAVETNVIAPMAAAFRSSGYDIKEPLRLLFNSEHFFDSYNVGAIIKPPLDLIVGVTRETKVLYPDNTDLEAQYFMWLQIALVSGQGLQQLIFGPPNVAGWAAYHQEPNYHELWISTVTLPLRNQITDLLIYIGLKKNGKKAVIDTADWLSQYPDADNVDLVIQQLNEHLLTHPLSANNQALLRTVMLGGQTTSYYWTQIWLDYKNNPTDTAKKKLVTDKLQSVLKYITSLEEFQLS